MSDSMNIENVPLNEISTLAITFALQGVKNYPLIFELIMEWDKVQLDDVIKEVEQFFLTLAQPYFIKNYADYPITNLQTKLYVLINSVMFTLMRYIHQKPILVNDKDIIETLSGMIVSVLKIDKK